MLQKQIGLVDLHLDTLIQAHLFRYRPQRRHRPGRHGQPLFWHADLPRMESAGYGAACMGIHGWPIESPARMQSAERQIDLLDALCEQDPSRVVRWRPGQPWPLDGRMVLTPGVEGAHILGGSLDSVDRLVARGVAYLTLAHFSCNSAASSSMGIGANERDGLTPFGHDLVRLLNDAGIVVDVSHVNQRGVLDACRSTRAPVLATHSGAQALHRHPRLLSPDAVRAVADTGGAVGVIFAPGFLTGSLNASTACVVAHIEAIADAVGIDHVAIGTDLDGWLPAIPSDMRDCTDTSRVTARLLARGWTESDLRKLLRDNALRVLTHGPAR